MFASVYIDLLVKKCALYGNVQCSHTKGRGSKISVSSDGFKQQYMNIFTPVNLIFQSLSFH